MKNKTGTGKNPLRRFFLISAAVLITAVLIFSALPVGQSFWAWAGERSGLQAYPSYIKEYPLNIYFMDVGKADAILIECEGDYALLDAGTSDKADEIDVWLRRMNVDRLSYVFASHPDKDHIGSMAEILSRYPLDTFIQPQIPPDLVPDTEEYHAMIRQLEEANVPVQNISAGESYFLGGAVIDVLSPEADRKYADVNDWSLVLKLRYGDFSVLFCGDIEKQAEKDICSNSADLSADVLKLPHHGSKTSSSEDFLQAVGARYAVICVGPDKNNLPKKSVLKRLDEMQTEVYRTDLDGTVIFTTDGDIIKIYQENAE